MMRKNPYILININIFVALTAGLFLNSCGKDSDKKDTASLPLIEMTEYAGTWVTDCIPSEKEGASFRNEVALSKTSFHRMSFGFDGLSCDTTKQSYKREDFFTEPQLSEDSDDWKKLSYIAVTATHMPLSVKEATILNTYQIWGYTDWQQGVAKSIFGRKYDASSTNLVLQQGFAYKTLIRLSGDKLIFAKFDKEHTASLTDEKRFIYTRKQ